VGGRLEPVDHVDARRGDDSRPLGDLWGRTAALLTGVARPERVAQTLSELGVRLVLHDARPDHAWLSPRAGTDFARRAAAAGADLLLTTEKDGARWGDVIQGMRAVRVDLRLEPEGAARLAAALGCETGISLQPVG
jgi:tetraacyldisaccharide-1-P 4'-kinase